MPARTDRFDVVVVGGGPGGMAAASAAARLGRHTMLLERRASLGGNVYAPEVGGPASPESDQARADLETAGVEVWLDTEVLDAGPTSSLTVAQKGGSCSVTFDRLILATGARERFLPFPGWTLPNVTGAGGAQLLAKGGAPVEGRNVVIAGTGPLLLAAAAFLRRRGARVRLIAEQAPWTRVAPWALGVVTDRDQRREGLDLRRQLRRIPYRMGCWVTRAEGDGRVERVVLRQGRREWSEPCDWLAVGFHLVPNTELGELLGCRVEQGRVVVDAYQRTSVPGVLAVGEAAGVGGRALAEVEGRVAGAVAAGRLEDADRLLPQQRKRARFRRSLDRTFRLDPRLRELVTAETLVCRCEDVAWGRLRGFATGREARLQTRCGMGRCQGRVCGPATEFLFGWRLRGTRPPLVPVPLDRWLSALPGEAAAPDAPARPADSATK